MVYLSKPECRIIRRCHVWKQVVALRKTIISIKTKTISFTRINCSLQLLLCFVVWVAHEISNHKTPCLGLWRWMCSWTSCYSSLLFAHKTKLMFVCSKILSLLGDNFLHFIVELLSTIRKWDVPTLCKSFIELSLSTVSSSATLHYGNKIFDSPLGKMEPNLVCFSAEDPR